MSNATTLLIPNFDSHVDHRAQGWFARRDGRTMTKPNDEAE